MAESATAEQLFKRWSELEPERCRKSEEMFDVLCESWCSVFSLRISGEPGLSGWGITQAVVQKAIQDRKLLFRITDASNHFAGVVVYEVDVLTDDFEEITSGEYTSPSYGLLACYLDAIEILAEQEASEAKPLQVKVSLEEYQALEKLQQPCKVEQLQEILKDERASTIFAANFHDRDVEVVVKQEGGDEPK